MSEKLNIKDFESDHANINRLDLNEGSINLLTVEYLKLIRQIELLSAEVKIIKEKRELINITLDKTDVKNSLYANNEFISVPIGTIVAFAGRWIPEGWELCDGRPITDRYPQARTIIGDRKPDLINRFIRGTDSLPFKNGGSDGVELVAENLPSHNHVYYEPRFEAGTRLIASGFIGSDVRFYNSHKTEFDRRTTNNDRNVTDHIPSSLEGRSFSIVPAHVTLQYIIKLK